MPKAYAALAKKYTVIDAFRYQGSIPSGDFQDPTEAHEHVVTGGTDPFINSAAGDFRLLAGTAAGIALPSPYNLDMNGNVRGADGTWDRGAFEFVSGSSPFPPSGPKNLRIR